MNPVDLETIETALVNPSISEEAAVSAIEALSALRRRDWSVRVLDACRRCTPHAESWETQSTSSGFYVEMLDCNRDCLDGPWELKRGADEDAARHAAALAVLPTLDAATQADLGETP